MGVRALILIVVVGSFLLLGCGQSKEDKVAAYLSSRKRPGLVRVINLTDQPAMYAFSNPKTSVIVPSGKDSRFSPIASGSNPIQITVGAKIYTEDAPIESKMALTYVILAADQAPVLVKGDELRVGEPNSALRVVSLGPTGLTSDVKGPSGNVTSEPVATDSASKDVSAGDYVVSIKKGGEVVGSTKFEAMPGMTYSVYVAERGGKVLVQHFMNTPHDKPVMAGAQ